MFIAISMHVLHETYIVRKPSYERTSDNFSDLPLSGRKTMIATKMHAPDMNAMNRSTAWRLGSWMAPRAATMVSMRVLGPMATRNGRSCSLTTFGFLTSCKRATMGMQGHRRWLFFVRSGELGKEMEALCLFTQLSVLGLKNSYYRPAHTRF